MDPGAAALNDCWYGGRAGRASLVGTGPDHGDRGDHRARRPAHLQGPDRNRRRPRDGSGRAGAAPARDAVTAAATAEAAGIFNIYDGVTTLADFLGCYAVMARTRLRRRSQRITRAKLRVKEWLGWLVGIYPAQNQRALAILQRAGEIPPRAEKAARELNWHPRFSLEEGMAAVRLAYFPEKPEEPHNAWQENETWVEKKDPVEPE